MCVSLLSRLRFRCFSKGSHLTCTIHRCVAVHPGYGFLSESADFVESIEQAGIAFLGPASETMRMFSRKHTAREFAISADVPVLPGDRLHASPKLPCSHPLAADQIDGPL